MASTEAISAYTYNNGLSGVGAKIWKNTNGLGAIDGVDFTVQARVLIKDQGASGVGNTFENGFYEVTRTGSGSTSWELQRTNDMDEPDEMVSGAFAFVLEGVRNSGNGFVQLTKEPVAIGTTALEYTQFTAPGQVEAGDGLQKTANTIDVVSADTNAIYITPDNINLKAINPSQSYVSTGSTQFVQAISIDSYGRVTGVVTTNEYTKATQVTHGVVRIPAEASSGLTISSGELGLTNWPTFTNLKVTGITTNVVTSATSNTTSSLTVTGVTTHTGASRWSDSTKLLIGSDNDLQVYHTGSIGYIDNNTGNLFVRNNVDNDDGGNIVIQAKSGEFYCR